VIKFTHATEDHSFVVNAILQPEQGITHDVFNQVDDEEAPVDEEGAERENDEEVERDIIDSTKHIHVPEVCAWKENALPKSS